MRMLPWMSARKPVAATVKITNTTSEDAGHIEDLIRRIAPELLLHEGELDEDHVIVVTEDDDSIEGMSMERNELVWILSSPDFQLSRAEVARLLRSVDALIRTSRVVMLVSVAGGGVRIAVVGIESPDREVVWS